MNEKLKNQVAEMKKQTIGVEIEMNSITRENASRVAAEFFGTGRWENTELRNGYRTWSAWDEQGREWKFQRDSSIEGPDDERSRSWYAACAGPGPGATLHGAAGSTSTSARRATTRRACGTWPTSWQATKASWPTLWPLTTSG